MLEQDGRPRDIGKRVAPRGCGPIDDHRSILRFFVEENVARMEITMAKSFHCGIGGPTSDVFQNALFFILPETFGIENPAFELFPLVW